MHEIPLTDASVDLVYSCHSLEHAFDIVQVLREFCRVLRNDGYIVIETPINYKTTRIDRWDLKSGSEISKILGSNLKGTLHLEDTDLVTRLVVQIKHS